MATASVALTVLSITLGLVCRFNFGKGLARYLNAHQELEDDEVRSQYSTEKAPFPSSVQPLPTYAYSFNEKDSYYSAGGPRFSDASAAPFEAPGVAYPAAAVARGTDDFKLHRSDSYGSTKSSDSDDSQRSHSRSDSNHSQTSRTGQKQRWIIE
jgi:hypothetical protein